MMPSRRAVSPAASENEIDIVGSLFNNAPEPTTRKVGNTSAQDGFGFDARDILRVETDQEAEDDEAFIASKQAASFRKASNLKGKTVKKGGGFQAMGLNANLLRAISRKGFSVPTPIQRKTIPLIMSRKDVCGMARTGSGKTAAFVIPMIERLKAHKPVVGARALILSPSRELALQTLKVVKDFSRGTDLKCILLVGGDSLEDQFSSMTSNPDIVIATPGRFLHLKVEMSLDLSSIQYAVFDEADRLFEMGFASEMAEILFALPASRQTLLFSATLPASLVEFARAGLQDPTLVRLDSETKISPDLQSAFFTVKSAEKQGALLHLLQDVIKIPLGLPDGVEIDLDKPLKKRKRGPDASSGKGKPTAHSTIIFTATKHRNTEYLKSMLREAGFAVSYVYGSLDQTARKEQTEDFRSGRSHVMVVTDVAARGIDIPILANVVNYDFPPQPKVFVHRVGRTARAGQTGWSYSLVKDTDAPYLIDLQLFLGKKLVLGKGNSEHGINFAEDMVAGSLVRNQVENNVEWLNKVLAESEEISTLRRVSEKAEKLYLRTRNSASSQSARRAKEVIASKGWSQLHPLFGEELGDTENTRADMLMKISGFKPQETIFEIKASGKAKAKAKRNDAAEVIKSIRERFGPRKTAKQENKLPDHSDSGSSEPEDEDVVNGLDDGEEDDSEDQTGNVSSGQPEEAGESDSDLEVTISTNADGKKSQSKGKEAPSTSFRDEEVFMSYVPRTTNAAEERGYGVHSGGGNFVTEAAKHAMDLTNDEGTKSFGVPTRAKMRWDKKSAKYVSRDNDEDGSRGAAGKGAKKMVRGESGVKIAASFQSGRFDRWRKAQRISRMPRVGEAEGKNSGSAAATPPQNGNNNTPITGFGGRSKFRHRQEKAPKEADKYRDDFHVRKRRVAEAREKRVGRFRDGMGSKKEIRNADDIRKARKLKERRKAQSARPSKKPSSSSRR